MSFVKLFILLSDLWLIWQDFEANIKPKFYFICFHATDTMIVCKANPEGVVYLKSSQRKAIVYQSSCYLDLWYEKLNVDTVHLWWEEITEKIKAVWAIKNLKIFCWFDYDRKFIPNYFTKFILLKKRLHFLSENWSFYGYRG